MIHISDLHFGQKLKQKNLVDAILKKEKPCPIHLTGDVTDDASKKQIAEAKLVLRPLIDAGFLLLIAPGNHDQGPSGIIQTDSAIELFDDFVQDLTGIPTRHNAYPICFFDGETNTAHIVLNSCTPPVLLARGNVGYTQRQRLAKKIETHQKKNRTIVVSLHHHPILNDRTLLLQDAAELLALLSHRCDFLLFGHEHVAGEWSNVYGIKKIFAADQTPAARRYRKIDVKSGAFEWASY